MDNGGDCRSQKLAALCKLLGRARDAKFMVLSLHRTATEQRWQQNCYSLGCLCESAPASAHEWTLCRQALHAVCNFSQCCALHMSSLYAWGNLIGAFLQLH